MRAARRIVLDHSLSRKLKQLIRRLPYERSRKEPPNRQRQVQMRSNPKMAALWLVLVALPAITGFLALGQIPAGIDQVPMHWNAAGQIDGWGKPGEMLGLGFIMAATNALMAFCWSNAKPMMDAGLVHGAKSPEGAKKVLVGSAVFIVVLNAGIYAAIIHSVLGAL